MDFILRLLTLFRSVHCPRCRTAMPAIRQPTSTRQMLLGGWSCHRCGCEMDRTGRAIDFDCDATSS